MPNPLPSAPTTVQHDDHWVKHGEVRLFVRRWTPATPHLARSPIILFHDSLGCVDLWRDLSARLCAATGRTVFAYDRWGFGRSSERSGALPLSFIADEAAYILPALRTQLGIDRFIALGHSVGGGVAIECAARFASDCAGLISIAAQAFVDTQIRASIRLAERQFRDPMQFARLQKHHGAKAAWVLDAWINTWLNPDFAGWSLRETLPKVTCPALIIHGADDEYGSPRHAEFIAEHLTGPTTCVILPDHKHMPHREDETGVLTRLAGFLETIRDA